MYALATDRNDLTSVLNVRIEDEASFGSRYVDRVSGSDSVLV